jgi:phosphate:Na+ symporter
LKLENTNFLFEFLHLLAGIGIFLTGCDLMSSSLEAVCSDRLRELLAKVSNNKIVGVLIGTAATIAISSSSAMTVMTIGFVNANILSLWMVYSRMGRYGIHERELSRDVHRHRLP